MHRSRWYGGLLASAMLIAGIGTLAVGPQVFASAGCGTTSNWHYISQYHSDVLDGSIQSYPTVVVALSDWYSAASTWQLRTQVWGTQDAINAIKSSFSSTVDPNTTVRTVTFND